MDLRKWREMDCCDCRTSSSVFVRVDAIPLSFLHTNNSWQEAVIVGILSVKEYG